VHHAIECSVGRCGRFGPENACCCASALGSHPSAVLEEFVDECGREFATVIVDEAGQAMEPSTLIPLR
jgi:superfamily I DNA and/or RNA helicase